MAKKTKRLYKNKKEGKLGGVCAGLAEYFEVDPNIVRVLWIVLTILSVGVGVLAYLALWFILPDKKEIK